MRNIISLILAYSLALGPVVLANPPKATSHVKVELTIADQKVATSEELKKLMEEAHENLEGEEEEGNFVQRWMAKFNFYRIGLNAYRWYSVKRADPRTADQALNLVLMLLGSHTIETIGGGMLASSSVNDTNPLVIAIKTILGIGITIPGFDPLCYALIGAYWRWPQAVNSALHYPRVAVVKSTSLLARYSGMAAVMSWMWENEPARAWLEERLKNAEPGTYVYEATVEGFDFTFAGESGTLKVTLKDSGTKLGVARLELKGKVSGRNFREWLKLFGWNAADAIREVVGALEKSEPNLTDLGKKVYVANVAAIDEGFVVETKPAALSFGAKDTFKPWKATKAIAGQCSRWIGQADAWLDSLDK